MNENEDDCPNCAAGIEKVRRLDEIVAHLRAMIDEIRELANWHSDDNADENDTSPRDMTAHVNGLIRQKCSAVWWVISSRVDQHNGGVS